MEGTVTDCEECAHYMPSDYDPAHGVCAQDATAQDFADWKAGRRKSMPEAIPVPARGWAACYGDCFEARA